MSSKDSPLLLPTKLEGLIVTPAKEDVQGRFWVDVAVGGAFLTATQFERRGSDVACIVSLNDEWGNEIPEPVVLTKTSDILRWLSIVSQVVPGMKDDIERVLFAFVDKVLNAYEEEVRSERSVSLSDFLADHVESQDLIPDMLPKGGFGLVVGSPESFKSFLVQQAAITLAGGLDDLFGIVPTHRLPAFYVSGEKSSAKVRGRFAKMAASSRMLAHEVRIVHRRGARVGTPSWGALVEEVRQSASEFGGCFTGLDTLASVAPPGFNENDGQQMGVVIDGVNQLINVGGTVLMAHHPARARASGGGLAGGDRSRGHTSLWGAVDVVLHMDRRTRSKPVVDLRCEIKDGDAWDARLLWDRESFLLSRADAGADGADRPLREQFRRLVDESRVGLSDEELARQLYPTEWDRADSDGRGRLRARVRAVGRDLKTEGVVARQGRPGGGSTPDRWVSGVK